MFVRVVLHVARYEIRCPLGCRGPCICRRASSSTGCRCAWHLTLPNTASRPSVDGPAGKQGHSPLNRIWWICYLPIINTRFPRWMITPLYTENTCYMFMFWESISNSCAQTMYWHCPSSPSNLLPWTWTWSFGVTWWLSYLRWSVQSHRGYECILANLMGSKLTTVTEELRPFQIFHYRKDVWPWHIRHRLWKDALSWLHSHHPCANCKPCLCILKTDIMFP